MTQVEVGCLARIENLDSATQFSLGLVLLSDPAENLAIVSLVADEEYQGNFRVRTGFGWLYPGIQSAVWRHQISDPRRSGISPNLASRLLSWPVFTVAQKMEWATEGEFESCEVRSNAEFSSSFDEAVAEFAGLSGPLISCKSQLPQLDPETYTSLVTQETALAALQPTSMTSLARVSGYGTKERLKFYRSQPMDTMTKDALRLLIRRERFANSNRGEGAPLLRQMASAARELGLGPEVPVFTTSASLHSQNYAMVETGRSVTRFHFQLMQV